jgi:molybdopterin-guanine dinucleotide biosynthesis protein A
MGTPKHLLRTARGDTLIEHITRKLSWMFSETLVVGSNLLLPMNNVRVIQDVSNVQSPLIGLYSGLLAARTSLAFVVACDMPFVKTPLVRHILAQSNSVDVCVPIVNGYYEPLCASYRQTAIPAIRQAINRDTLKLTSIYKHLEVLAIPEKQVRRFDPALTSFINLNVPRQLKLLARI